MIDEDGEVPTLDPATVEDEQALAAAADDVIRLDPVAHARAVEIGDYVDCLRTVVDADTWKLVLEIDARVVERWSDVVVVIARWGFEQGRRHPIGFTETAS